MIGWESLDTVVERYLAGYPSVAAARVRFKSDLLEGKIIARAVEYGSLQEDSHPIVYVKPEFWNGLNDSEPFWYSSFKRYKLGLNTAPHFQSETSAYEFQTPGLKLERSENSARYDEAEKSRSGRKGFGTLWEDVLVEAAGFIYETNPKSQEEIVKHCLAFFEAKGTCPGRSAMIEHISPLYKRMVR